MYDQIRKLETALRDLMTAYAACNGEDHPAYERAEKLLAGKFVSFPAPQAHLRVTDEMVEAACAAHWVDPWPGDRSKPALKSARVNMRAALEAALATTEGQPDA